MAYLIIRFPKENSGRNWERKRMEKKVKVLPKVHPRRVKTELHQSSQALNTEFAKVKATDPAASLSFVLFFSLNFRKNSFQVCSLN